jgi:hypothetical protein
VHRRRPLTILHRLLRKISSVPPQVRSQQLPLKHAGDTLSAANHGGSRSFKEEAVPISAPTPRRLTQDIFLPADAGLEYRSYKTCPNRRDRAATRLRVDGSTTATNTWHSPRLQTLRRCLRLGQLSGDVLILFFPPTGFVSSRSSPNDNIVL